MIVKRLLWLIPSFANDTECIITKPAWLVHLHHFWGGGGGGGGGGDILGTTAKIKPNEGHVAFAFSKYSLLRINTHGCVEWYLKD